MSRTILVKSVISGYRVPNNINDFIKFFQKESSKIPRKFRDSVHVDFDVEEDYGSYVPMIKVSYERPETPSEVREREAEENSHNTRSIAYHTKELERLKGEVK